MNTVIGVLSVSQRRQRQLSRILQLGVALMLAVGLLTLNTSVVVNASLALAVTALPAVLERDYRIPLDAGLTLWITSAVFLHTLGMYGLYDGIW